MQTLGPNRSRKDEEPMNASTGHSRLADPNGTFAMVAVDQRDSLRKMLAISSESVHDDDMRSFKAEVARVLSPNATGLLVDVDYGLDAIVSSGGLAAGCPLIVAVDAIEYGEDGGTRRTGLRRDLFADRWSDEVAGLKLLLLWSPGGWLGPTAEDLRDFVAYSAEHGLESVLEVVVRDEGGQAPAPSVQASLLVDAAREMAPYGATLYKTEVPYLGQTAPEEVTAASTRLTSTLQSPWVVLSSGVPAEQFPDAVRATRAGGASGFLAGRAIWGAAARGPAADRNESLRTVGTAALAALVEAL